MNVTAEAVARELFVYALIGARDGVPALTREDALRVWEVANGDHGIDGEFLQPYRDTAAAVLEHATAADEQRIVEINSRSEAADELSDALGDSAVYKITIAFDGGLKIKVNEGTWTPPLKTDGYP